MFLPLQTCVFVQSASQSRCINIPELVTPWFGMLMFLFFDCSSTKQKSTSSCRVNIPKLAMNHCSMISAILILVGGSSHVVCKWFVSGVSSPILFLNSRNPVFVGRVANEPATRHVTVVSGEIMEEIQSRSRKRGRDLKPGKCLDYSQQLGLKFGI